MFDELRDAFRQAVRNFRTELRRDEVPDTIDALLRKMKGEIVDLRAYVKRLEEDLEKARTGAEREAADAETCRRREELARRVPDEETARVAAEFAERHEKRARVLREKARALEEELRMRREEVAGMEAKWATARSERDRLTAQAGRAEAREALDGVRTLFDDLDRMAERVDDEERRAEAAGDLLDDEEGEAGGGVGLTEEELERRIREIRRRQDGE